MGGLITEVNSLRYLSFERNYDENDHEEKVRLVCYFSTPSAIYCLLPDLVLTLTSIFNQA